MSNHKIVTVLNINVLNQINTKINTMNTIKVLNWGKKGIFPRMYFYTSVFLYGHFLTPAATRQTWELKF